MKIKVVMGIMLALFLASMFSVAPVFADMYIAIKGDPATGTVFPDPDPATGVVGNTATWFLSASIRHPNVFPNAHKVWIFVWTDPATGLTPWGETDVSGFTSPGGYADGWQIVTGPFNTPGTFKYTITITDINDDVIFSVDPYLIITPITIPAFPSLAVSIAAALAAAVMAFAVRRRVLSQRR